MTLRQAMLQAARRAPALLGPSAPLVADFLRSQLHDDGGFRGRAETSDLYYTVFGLESLLALGEEFPWDRVSGYLRSFGGGESLDFVHLCCLDRCWASVLDGPPAKVDDALLKRLGAFRMPDGGFSPVAGAEHGTAYGCFLALGAWGDCEAELPDEGRFAACLAGLRSADGGYGNEPGSAVGSTPATAAALVVLRHLGQPVPEEAVEWLRARCLASGGFLAAPAAPMPDLLSTATALHALAATATPLDDLREPCLDFIDSLWDRRGGFHGTWADDALDCEYTYYGLLALGHLAPRPGANHPPSPRGRGLG